MDSTLKDRVKKILESERISNSEFAAIAQVSVAYVNSIKKNMSFEMLDKLYKINPKVSIPWLLWGIGEMYCDYSNIVQQLQDENAILRDKVSLLQKIVSLYERNEKVKWSFM